MTVHTVIELGGNISRLPHACRVALALPDAQLIISSEGGAQQCLQTALDAGLPRERIHLDYQAWDTVTNFTKTAALVKSLGTTDLHVVTDGFHMRRSIGIALIVYAMTGIRCHAEPSSNGDPEPWCLTSEDWLRALVWRLTGYQHIWRDVYDQRMPYYRQQAEIAATL
jgi:uncharacterized SAM-binding protein YcdF (DUF218 family)